MNRLLPVIFLTCLQASAVAGESGITIPPGIMTPEPQPAPGLKLGNLDGETYDIGTSRGHWVFVHFWASWCGPCRKEMPTIQRMVTLLDESSVEVVLVNTAETEDTVFSFLGIVAPDLDTLLDYDGQVTEGWKPRGLPSSFLVDPGGQIRYQALGDRPWDQPEYLDFIRSLEKQN